jgi:hypothetical protein
MPDEQIFAATKLEEQISTSRERSHRMLERAAEALQHGSKLLQRSWPDIFLGRQHHDFVPLPEETTRDAAKNRIRTI